MYLLVLTLCLASLCQGDVVPDTSPVREPRSWLGDPQSDAYIDEILNNLRQMIMDNNWDPIELPPLETGFSDTILGITWHGEAWVSVDELF